MLDDAVLLARLKDVIERATTARLMNFAPSPADERLAERLGLPVMEGPFAASQRWGGKSGSKQIFAASGIPCPRGELGTLHTVDDIGRAAMALAGTTSPARRVIVKLDDASWGDAIGNAVIDCDRIDDLGDLAGAVDTIHQPWDDFVHEVARSGAIVEEYLEDVACSPSGQGFVDADGRVSVSGTHEQITVDGQYLGCRFPGRPDFVSRVRAAVVEVGGALHARGVRGTFGVDFVGLRGGDLLATEINVRKIGPSHALAYARAVSRDDGGPGHYVHRRFYEPLELAALDPDAAVQALRDSGLLYDSETREGALLHILGALRTCGYVEITSIAQTQAAAEAVDRRVQAALLENARRRRRRALDGSRYDLGSI